MNSTFLRILAVFMVIAAIVTATLGYRMSNKKPDDSLKVVVPTYTQAVARIDLPVGHVLTAEDIEVVQVQLQDNKAFSSPQLLLGKVTTMAVVKGAPFKTSHFPVLSQLGQVLAPHERAVAIKVNEVVGVGGFIKPGDHVDVLLYLRTDRETGEVSSAQIVLADVKVLAYGTLTSEAESNTSEEVSQAVPNKLGSNGRRSDSSNRKDSRSAILAVHERDMSRLMLADSTGVLRLALRGAALATNDLAAGNQFIRLQDVSQSSVNHSPAMTRIATSTVALTTNKKAAQPVQKREKVIVHRGDAVEIIQVAR